MGFFAEILATIATTYALVGAAYMLRLSWDSITARWGGLFAVLCMWALWPLVFWSEVEHALGERRRRRAYQVPSPEYLAAVARLSAERRSRSAKQ